MNYFLWMRYLVFSSLGLSSFALSAPVTEIYQYDALGRLDRVEADNAPLVEYCYDKAGNRRAVVPNGAGDCITVSMPAPPTNLQYSTHWGSGYTVYWQPSAGATYYVIVFGNVSTSTYYVQGANVSTFSTGQNTLSKLPNYMMACNQYACSEKVYF